jgi:DNA modification methylase
MIYTGDCLEILPTLDAESVQCCVTSPPYYGLRDYGHDGQIGLESTPEAYVDKLVAVFREVRRVLRNDGVLWLNLGDSYAAGRGGTSMPAETLAGGKNGFGDNNSHRGRLAQVPDGKNPNAPISVYQPHRNAGAIGLKHKDLIGIPWRVAFALQADGWWLRQDIIWNKPNPMPESVTDRCTKAHEYIFLLTKSARYFYDNEAIKEDFADDRMGNPGKYHAGLKDCMTPMGIHGRGVTGNGWNDDGAARGRNRRSVWTITTKPFKEAHFATFPPEIPEICIKAGSKMGDTILDPFSGAGTTGNVAERLGRKYIGIELNPTYSEMGEKRIDTARLPLAEQWG